MKETPDDNIYDKMVEVVNNPNLKSEDLKAAAVSLHKKLEAAYYYTPATKLRGKVTLIRIQDNFIHVDKDYGLSQVIVIFKYLMYPNDIEYLLSN